MATYSSREVTLQAPATVVFDKFSNLENLRGLLDKVPAERIPEDKRGMYENIRITNDTISVPGGPMGDLTFRVTEREAPHKIKLVGEGVPVNIALILHVKEKGAESSEAKVDIDIDIPMMLRPMIGGQIQKMADQFGDVLSAIPLT